MAIPRSKQTELRLEALSIIWKILDAKCSCIELARDGLTHEEVLFVRSIIDQRAQRAYTEYANLKKKHGLTAVDKLIKES